jgi:hypothetical protein
MIERIKRWWKLLNDPKPQGDLSKHRLYSEMYEDLRQ